jgi:2-(1,2-epoxy-1,2-dihydrophenyl)acetyl-CoA isomerase
VGNLVEVSDVAHVRTIRLNRPEKKNALSDALAWGVVDAVEEAAKTDGVWVIVITGSGDSFCSGLDLSGAERFSPLSAQSAQLDDISWVGQFLLSIRKRCDKPVVGGINGVPHRGGCFWASKLAAYAALQPGLGAVRSLVVSAPARRSIN